MAKNKLNNFDFNKYFGSVSARMKNNVRDKKKRRIIFGAIAFLILAFLIYIITGLPSLEELENPKPQLASKVFTVDGELLGQFYFENRIETHIDSVPRYLVDALISTEDKGFYNHWGVDMSRFVKAMIKNVFTFSREGASTLTQQLAKNLYQLKGRNENFFDVGVRKIREWITAVQIERTYTKNEIIELYLNISYFGRSAYGIESASKVYFDKRASELTLPEAALFIALLKSPEYYDPVRKKENALRRRNVVMYNMVKNEKLGESEYQKLKEQPITLTSERIGGARSIAPHFMEYLRQQLEAMADKYGYNLYMDGLNIYTTLDYKMQKCANQATTEHLKEYQEIFNKNWKWENNQSLLTSLIDKAIKNSEQYRLAYSSQDKGKVYNRLKYNPKFVDSVKTAETIVQTGFVVIDPSNGEIRALVGGQNQDFGRGLNHVTGIKRQPGSSFKPIVYAVAIDNGYSPAYTLLNQKFNYNGWSPDNSNGDYGGYMTLRQGLANSVNVIAGRLTISGIAPPSQVVKFARRMGIKSELNPYPSIALGTSEVSPLELTSAFGTFANNGVLFNPISIIRIEDKNGIVIADFIPEYKQALSPQTASIMADMMQDVVNYGTGAGVRRYFHRPAAGKTGTTQDFADAWFVGFTPQLVGGVWVGFDDHRIKFTNWYGQGAKAALPIWAKFMEKTYKELDLPLKYFNLASGVEAVNFCVGTLELGDSRIAGPNCPDVIMDLVMSKYMPQECELHKHGVQIKPEDKKGDIGW
jgi:penicillin-binding protein 1A